MRYVGSVVGLSVCWVLLYWFLVQGHGHLNGQVNLGIGQAYLSAKYPFDLVWVGSSMTQRIPNPENKISEFNVSMGGQSSITGLEIVRSASHLPNRMIVEVSFSIGEPIDHRLMESLLRSGRWLWIWFPVFREEYKLMQLFEHWVNQEMARRRGRGFETKPPSDTERYIVDAKLLNMYIDRYSNPSWCSDVEYHDRCRRMVNLLNGIALDGVGIYLYRPFVHPLLAQTPVIRKRQEILENALQGGPWHWLPTFSERSLDTTDGLHMTPGSGLRARAMLLEALRRGRS